MPELRTYSLHRRLIVWLVIPMLVMSIAILVEAYVSARESAQAIYDRLLLGLAFSISEHTVITEGDLLSDEVLGLMTQRTSDTIAYRVTGPDGAFVTGLHGIPPIPENRTLEGGVPIFYNAVFEGEPVRMVALSFFIEHPEFEGWVLVQVLQTMGERHAMVWQAVTRSGLRLILARGINLEAGAGDLVVEGNTALLGEILNNLIDNALSRKPWAADLKRTSTWRISARTSPATG